MLPLNAAPKPICVARLREVARLSLRSVVVGLSDADSDEFSNIERDAVGVFYGETWHVCMALRCASSHLCGVLDTPQVVTSKAYTLICS